jgi:hypothetical protein
MDTLLQVLLDGILNGMLYALVAVGLCLIWGVMDVINFAQLQGGSYKRIFPTEKADTKPIFPMKPWDKR